MKDKNNSLKRYKGIIYLFRNVVNGKVLIGQTIWNFTRRYGTNPENWHQHASNEHFKRALLKYGWKNFTIELLEHSINEQVLLDFLEQFYIKKFQSENPKFGYNKTSGGDHAKFTEEHKQRQRERLRENVNDFIAACQKEHDNKYDYSKVEYFNARHNIIIICPIHGEFKQIAHSHKCGSECPKCIKHSSVPLTPENINERIKTLYDTRYKVLEYDKSRKKVLCECQLHGHFQSNVYNFLNEGAACQLCRRIRQKTLKAQPIGCFTNHDDFRPAYVFVNIPEAVQYITKTKERLRTSNIFQAIRNKKMYAGFYWRKITPYNFILYKILNQGNFITGDLIDLLIKYEGLIKKHKISTVQIFDEIMPQPDSLKNYFDSFYKTQATNE